MINKHFRKDGITWKLENGIERVSQQEVFGDLNGSHESFIDHLENRDLIKVSGEDIEWVGGNKDVVRNVQLSNTIVQEGSYLKRACTGPA